MPGIGIEISAWISKNRVGTPTPSIITADDDVITADSNVITADGGQI